MSTAPLFDLIIPDKPIAGHVPPTGKDLRDAGIQQALDHVLQVKSEYVTRCLSEITKLESGTLFTSESLRGLAGDPPAGCENSIAGILKKAAGRGLIRNSGQEKIAERVTIHAKRLSIWIKL